MELSRHSFHVWVESVDSLLCFKRFIIEAPKKSENQCLICSDNLLIVNM